MTAMSKAEKLRARAAALEVEADLAELEDAFVEKKLAGEATREDRLELRAAREDFRVNHRDAIPKPLGAGVASPEKGNN